MRAILAIAAAAACFAPDTSAQRLLAARPDIGFSGDRIVIEGSDLQTVSEIDFTAVVGGFAGTHVRSATPIFQTGQFIVVEVPSSFGFAPPSATPPGSPLGSVGFTDINGRRQSVPFYFLLGTFYGPRFNERNPQTVTVGRATSQGGGQGASISFEHAGGHPFPGNRNLTMKLVNTLPNQAAGMFIGLPAPVPLMFGDGEFVVDLLGPNIVLPALTDSSGTAVLPPLRVPGPARGVDVVFQWAMFNATVPGSFACSNGLRSRM